MAKAKNKKEVVLEEVAVVETVKPAVVFEKIKNNSTKNMEALVLAAMFLSEGTASQVDKSHKDAVLVFLRQESPEIQKAILSLEQDGMVEQGMLTPKGRTTVIKRNNWSLENQFSLSFAEFLRNTTLSYQLAALKMLIIGDETKDAMSTIDKVSTLIEQNKFTPTERFKEELLGLTKKLINLCDDCGLSDAVDAYVMSSETAE